MVKPTGRNWASASAAFEALSTLPADSWIAALEAATLEPDVRDAVGRMLEAHHGKGPLDDRFAAGPARPPYRSLDSGTRLGAFRIDRLIGRGGMGEVYQAERVEGGFQQRVAVKLLRPEAAERIALFDAERRLLAQIEHPGIARLIDGGVAGDGRPFMVVEFVEGEGIAAWCARHGADLATRLRLMLEICDAVSYAHSRLIIHRDLKPANILVDEQGRTRLLDFGVAKIIDDVAPDQTLTEALLTPDYAAPEQFQRAPATVATDIYALGAVLYELLAGTGAWRREDGMPSSLVSRLIDDEPVLPSRAASRLPTPPVPPPQIAGDLDAIVMKAMRHDPAYRYASVATMADDIRRHLRFEPVQARRGTFGYQLRRFVRRHRAATVAAVAAVLALVAGVAGFAWQAHRVAVERDIARAQARRAEAVNEAVSLMFRNAQDFGKGGAESAKELLNDSAGRLIRSFDEGAPETAPVVTALAELYLQVNDIVGAQTLLAAALEKGVGSDDPIARARLEMTLGTVEGATGKLDEAERLLDRADRLWSSDPARFRKERLESGAAWAQLLRQRGKRDEAIAMLQRLLPEAEAEYAGDPRTLMIRYNNLAVHLVEASRLNELNAILRRGEALVAREQLQRTPLAISLMQLRGGWYARRDETEQALATFERAATLRRALYGPSQALAADLLQVGRSLLGLGRVDAAMPVLIEAKAMAAQYAGPTSPVTLMTAMTLAEGYAERGQVTAARAALASAEAAVRALGPTGILNGVFLRARAQVRFAQGDRPGANRDLDAAARVFDAIGTPAAPFSKSIAGLRRKFADRL